ncbi:unnamed protein product [Durusdinium trenchii]|uniref:Ubiquitin-like domain-containing protein n=1 Tax=Durusdinium trenchii TaxID=1381693 RepID=A0ABP0ML86_9DINO
MDAAAPDAADAAGMAESAAESAPSRKRPHEDADPQSFWKAQLEAIYARRNPMKVDSIPDLLQKYRGKEAVLYAKVCHKYDWNPKKFHIDPQAWLEYDLTEHHGHQPSASPGDATAEPFEVQVTTVSGANSCKINGLLPSISVKEVLIQSCDALKMRAWCSKLCLGTEKLSMDLQLSQAGVSAGSSLTLIQEPDAEFVEFQQRFMPEPLEAREAVLEEASEEYHQVMNAEFRGQGSGEECLLSSSAKSMCLSLADSEHHKRWRVESTNLIG